MSRKIIKRIVGYLAAAIVSFLAVQYPELADIIDPAYAEETIGGILFMLLVSVLELRSPRDEKDN